MTTLEWYASRRLGSLHSQLEAGSTGALDNFWSTLQGTPLIEIIEGDEQHLLVTFLWRSADDLANVTVVGGLAGYNFAGNQMTRLLDTDLWYRSYRARTDTRTTYWLSPDDSLVPAADVNDWGRGQRPGSVIR